MPSLKSLGSLLLATLAGGCIAATPKIPYYIIRNAEAPSLGRPGLTPIGKMRAENCIPGALSQFNIGLIITCNVDKRGETGLDCPAANLTVVPLAQSLGVNITTCDSGEDADGECTKNTITNFNKHSNQSVLVVWGTSDYDHLIEYVDLDDAVGDAGHDKDVILMSADLIVSATPRSGGKESIIVVQSMNCTGIDGTA
ncbi:hypothetical protein L218DRAFT_948558 [Marasmius fiardii PR-910]|nr:hypothetical protein L218DRAFT_948558 [Marasmius fiardii PR-910]